MRHKQKIINLFDDKEISSIKHVISIGSEEDLNQFWDFSTNSNSASYELIHTFVAKFYNFAIKYMHHNRDEFFDIILEESDENFYFTLWNKKISLSFEESIKKSLCEYLRKENRITIRLDKSKYLKEIQKINKKNLKRQKNLLNPQPKKQKPYTFLAPDDLKELLDLNDDMQDIIYNIHNSRFNDKIFISLRSKVSLFCFTLRYYEQLFPMANTITNFSNLMNTNENQFKNFDILEFKIISGFIQNIDSWIQTLFIKGGANLYFMDNSMKADYAIIEQIIDPKISHINESDSLDDIFNF
jgi:predicted DNA binding CopG/RHH family protein